MKFDKLLKTTAFAAVLGTAAISFSSAASAADWPAGKPIDVICVTTPKSGVAQFCRVIANGLTQVLNGNRVDVLFEGGGGGNTAGEMLMKKPADGLTLMQRSTSMAGYMSLPTWKPNPDDFDVLTEMVKFLYAIAVPANSKYKTFNDLIADMKAHPMEIPVAANKPGSVHHVHLLNLFHAFGVDQFNFVPYEGSGDAMRDVLGGHVPVGIVPTGIWNPQVKAGKGRTLLLINEDPDPATDAPTPAQLGHPYNIQHQLQGFFVKKGTPPEIRAKLLAALDKVHESQEWKDYIKNTDGAVDIYDTDGPKLTKQFNTLRLEIADFLKKNGLIQ